MIPGIIADDDPSDLGISAPPNTKFVAVGWNSSNDAVIISSVDGSAWVDRAPDPGGNFRLSGVAYNDTADRWVAAGDAFYYSDDAAVTWTRVTPTFSGGSYEIFGICWTGSRFIAVGKYASLPLVAVSTDGVSWTEKTPDPNTAGRLLRCAGVSGLAIAGGRNGAATTARIMSSADDGDTWTSRTTNLGASTTVEDVAIKTSGGTAAVCVADGGGSVTRIVSSSDGTTWTARTSDPATGIYWNGVVWNGSVFCAVGVDISTGSFPKVNTSPTGATWTARTATPSSDFYPLGVGTAGDGSIVAVGVEDGFADPRMMYSTNDGVTWTQVFPPVTTNIQLIHVAGKPNWTP